VDRNELAKFDVATDLASTKVGRRLVRYKAKSILYLQGSPADLVFYLREGRAKLTVVSKNGKEATVTLLVAGDFVGQEAITATNGIYSTTATAIATCGALEIDKIAKPLMARAKSAD
jgi:CRP/FNR family cyclic AMP-dependent transcriptional regulator